MIQKLSHVTLFVNNQDEAKDFYINKLVSRCAPTTRWKAASAG